ncbi:MAG: ATP-dependent RecD-like DNA helicase, partial [Candidatus Adiutrix sp.]|nr:ATP-dependent RecD-like DNA helicase [Candidatus Adiutrix sp.]
MPAPPPPSPPNAGQETISGRIERVTFANPDNGWAVLTVRAPKMSRPLTAVGHLPGPAAGEFIEMEGAFIDHPKYGRQFQVSRARLLPPKTEDGLKKYLGSGLIKGLGPVLAGRLVDRFGPATLDILDNSPERLTEVPGLGGHRREVIIEGWRRSQGLKRLLEFRAEFGLGPAVGLKAIRRLGDEADRLIREDPYRLAYDIDGVGFATADKVARRLGLAPDDPRRLAAGLLYALTQAAEEGHVFTPDQDLLAAGRELIPEAGAEALKAALNGLILEGQVKSELQEEPGGVDLYPPRLHRAETWVARDLAAILRTPALVEVPRRPQALAWAEKALNLNLSESQRQAVAAALEKKILVITGGPGTGKTTLTRAITAIFGALRARLGLVAPTGRAARRLAEATGLPAKTVHRLLEYAPQAGGFQRGPNRRLEVDLLLMDEASMVDLPLMNQLTGALPPQARLILVGDRDQLPSVGPGRVLADLIDSGAVAVARLTEVHRQAGGSWIVRAAHQVRRGLFPESSPNRDQGDFYFLEENDPEKILAKLVHLVTKKIPAKLGVNPREDIQVLTPMHGRNLGTEHLNQVLSDRLNPGGGPALVRFGRRFRRGDRVMQLKNNYQREVFNGDGGLVESLDLEAQELTVNFEGRPVVYDFADLDELTLAYAITIHKAQG